MTVDTKLRSAAFALLAFGAASCDGSTGPAVAEEAFPALTLATCDGEALDMASYLAAHDVTYVTFGAKWCTACQHEAPIINAEVVDHFEGQSVGAIQILIEDDPGEAPPLPLCAAWRDQLGARFDVVIDLEQVTLDPFFDGAVATLPLHLVVTGDQVIRYEKLGDIPANLPTLLGDWL